MDSLDITKHGPHKEKILAVKTLTQQEFENTKQGCSNA
jgi:hypothetical protein